ncbi:hypothetical protein [Streptomyces sp. A1136]|nr:hypothetical protein [Streptomyces sp. A1136]
MGRLSTINDRYVNFLDRYLFNSIASGQDQGLACAAAEVGEDKED